MKIIDVNDVLHDDEVAIVLGDFDGLHIGHQTLINTAIDKAKSKNIKSSVLFFKTHTRFVIKKDTDLTLLSDNKQKLSILKDLGVDIVYTIDFNKEMMSLPGEEFVRKILVEKLNAKFVVVGFNYRFGHKAACDATDLKKFGEKYGFEAVVVEPVCVDEQLISSTLIRNLIKEGNISEANKYLGRDYAIKGKVVEGNKRGKRLGFPTANLEIDSGFTVPKIGIYKTNTVIDDKVYLSVTSVGMNPTFHEDEMKIETHILNFDKNIYGKRLELRFLEYMRNEIKFNTEKELTEQVFKDIHYVKNN